jgi:alpha-tubulin suppressor-like RCC1 family protein
VAVAAAGDPFSNHGLALLDDGTVYAWGDNTYGQSTVPVGLSNVVAVAAQRYLSLALRADGTIVTWGIGGTEVVDKHPLNNVVALAAGGGGYTLALKRDGSVTDWGGGSSLPGGLTSIAAIAVGGEHRLALRRNGKVLAWGRNTYGQTNGVGNWSNVIAIAAGAYHSLALKSNGTVLAVGNSQGGTESSVPASLSNIVSISTLGWAPIQPEGGAPIHAFSLALKSNSTVVGWGDNSCKQATPPAGLDGVIAVAAGGFHSLALKYDSTVLGWGYNKSGQATGVPTTSSPYCATGQVMIAGQVLSNVVAITAGAGHSLALKNDGTVVGWGDNYYGQISVPAAVSNVVALAAGESQSLAIQLALQIASITLSNQEPVICFHTFAGQNYSVEYSPDLSPNSWSPLPNGTVSGDGQDAAVTDTDPAIPGPRFYRVRRVP